MRHHHVGEAEIGKLLILRQQIMQVCRAASPVPDDEDWPLFDFMSRQPTFKDEGFQRVKRKSNKQAPNRCKPLQSRRRVKWPVAAEFLPKDIPARAGHRMYDHSIHKWTGKRLVSIIASSRERIMKLCQVFSTVAQFTPKPVEIKSVLHFEPTGSVR